VLRRFRPRLTYANVTVTLLAFVVLGGGAYAAVHLPKNSVGTRQLKKNAVTSKKVKNNSLTGSDLKESTLSGLKAGKVTAMALKGNATCGPVFPLPPGVTSQRVGGGDCKITFPSSITTCKTNATVHGREISGPVIVEPRTAQVLDFASDPNSVDVWTFAGSSQTNLSFDLTLIC
jgi:hypothetical protein